VINEIGAVFNVRIEGDTDANLFYTDATNSRVGVGLISPTEKLEVVGNIKLSGNVIPASGFGIDFAATSGTGTSELLADYEEGTWTPVDVSGAGLVFTGVTATYTKIGRTVSYLMVVTIPATVSPGAALIGGLPFAPSSDNFVGIIHDNTGVVHIAIADPGSGGRLNIYPAASTTISTWASLSTETLQVTGTYFV
jgi:hypothetical protein